MPAKKNRRKNGKQLPRFLSRTLLFLFILILIGLSSFWGLNFLFKHNSNFKIKIIELDMPEELKGKFTKYNFLIGEPISSVDLAKIADYTPEKYPYLEYIRVSKKLPNCIAFEAKLRSAVARTSKELLLDSKGVVFQSIFDKDYSQLPLISGIMDRNVELGKPIKSERLDLAYYFLKEIPSNNVLSSYILSEIDIGNTSNATLMFKDAPEIRIGDQNLDKRLFVLAKIISDVKQELNQIKYIDLRFKDPVIGYK